MRISDWSSDVCSSDLRQEQGELGCQLLVVGGRRPLEGVDVGGPHRVLEAPRLAGEGRVLDGLVQHSSRAAVDAVEDLLELLGEIGRASCRERVCQYV